MNTPLILKLSIILILGLSINGQLKAQNSNSQDKSITLIGHVIDAESQSGLEFATVAIYSKKNNQVVDGCLSGTNGQFELPLKPDNYYAKIEFISYASSTIDSLDLTLKTGVIDLGTIELTSEGQLLDDIEITAEKSETIFALDKKVFTVGKDLANRGGSAEDILDNVPSVTVDIDGNVSLRGSDGVRILIDGRPSGLAGVGNTNGLRNIAANLIERVEVITNPSARYEAEGMAGIINIILKKNQSGGFNGSFDLTAGIPLSSGISTNLNYRKGKLNWFANYGLNYNKNVGGGNQIQDRLFTDQALNIDQRQLTFLNRDRNRKGISNSFRFGADYFLNDNDQLTASFLYRKSDEDNTNTLEYIDHLGNPEDFAIDPLWVSRSQDQKAVDFDDFKKEFGNDNLYNITDRTDLESEKENNIEYSLNYRKTFSSSEHQLNLNAQFREKSENESSELLSRYRVDLPGAQADESQTSENDESDKSWLFQLDYVHPLGKDHKFETGLRSSLKDITNDYIVKELIDGQFQPINSFTNNFLYDENIHAAYGIYGNTLNKFSYQFGLRGEYSFINTILQQENVNNKRDYFNLFPSGHLNYNFSEQSALQISYSRRVRRPGFRDLNPFFTFSDDRNFFSGNPNINPEFTDSYDLGQIQYWESISLNTSIFYRRTEGSIQRVLIIDSNNATTLRTPINIGISNDYGVDLSLSYSGLKWLRLDANCNVFINQLKLNPVNSDNAIYDYYKSVQNYNGTVEDFNSQFVYSLSEYENLTWNGRLTARITFWKSDLQIRTNYRAASESAQGRNQAVGSIDLGWSKDFLESKDLTFTLSLRDLLNSRKRNDVSILNDFYQQSEFQWRGRSFTLTASYRINQNKKKGGDRSEGGEGNFDGGEF